MLPPATPKETRGPPKIIITGETRTQTMAGETRIMGGDLMEVLTGEVTPRIMTHKGAGEAATGGEVGEEEEGDMMGVIITIMEITITIATKGTIGNL